MKLKVICQLLLLILLPVIIFHLLVLIGLVPYNAIWGGRLKTVQEMYVFETISLLFNVYLLIIVLQLGGYIRRIIPRIVLKVSIGFYVLLFGLNTIGNLWAVNIYERILGTIFTAILTYLCFRLLMNLPQKETV